MKFTLVLTVSALSTVAFAQSPVWGQCGGQGWTGPTTCVSGSCCTYSNEWYSQCLPCGGNTNPGTTAQPTPTSPAPTAVTTTLPASQGSVATSAPIRVTGNFDGGMKKYDRSPRVCQEQTETGESDSMFILESGATLQNVIIGPNQAEGVHCRGTCTLINVWFQDVCEDAVTLKQSSGTSYIRGGGAFHAADKIIQFNGRGTVEISNFYANDYGKIVRSCGNCSNNGGPRNIIMNGVVGVNGGPLCGINVNYGDTCRMTNCCQNDGKSCDRYQGVSGGGSSPKLGTGPDGTYCTTSNFRENC